MKFRVSELETFRQWEQDDAPEKDALWLVERLTHFSPTPEMRKGTAFHAALEKAQTGTVELIDSQGYTFLFDGDYELALPKVREVRREKDYSGLIVTGQVDAIAGKVVIDHKTSGYFDAERYFAGYQWRYYLDIFGADCFRWYVWMMSEDELNPDIYHVNEMHILEQYRYPDLEKDCAALAGRFKAFAEQYLAAKPSRVIELGITDDEVAAVTK